MNPVRSSPARAAAAAMLLAGCGGGSPASAPPDGATRVEVLASSARSIGNIAYHDGAAWLTLSNSAQAGSAVMKTPLPLHAQSRWTEVPLGACALPRQDAGAARTPQLRALGADLWLFQAARESRQGQAGEHGLCALDAAGAFAPRDQALGHCLGGWCAPLAMSELKLAGQRLYTNAGAGPNLFVSDDAAAGWRVVLGRFESMTCSHQAFQVVGERLLVGGACLENGAWLRAYRLGADGALASATPLPLALPALGNRKPRFIEQVAGSQRVFVGVDGGGLLRSDDGGQSFRFVIDPPAAGGGRPEVRALLALSGKPDTLVAGGTDGSGALPWLAWSADGGSSWTDISALLPGHARAAGDTRYAEVGSLSQDPQGQLIVTLNLNGGSEGRVLRLSLGRP